MEKKTNRKILYTKRVIRESLLALLDRKPLKAITVKDIVALADINRSTFYTHYRDIWDLIREIEAEMAQHVIDAMAKLYQTKNYHENVVNALFDAFLDNREMCIWLMDDHMTGYGKKLIETYIREKCVPVWQKQKGITKTQAEWFFRYIFDGTFGFFKGWYESGFSGDAAQMKKLFNEFTKNSMAFIYS